MTDKFKHASLMIACAQGFTLCVKALVACENINLNSQDRNGRTALMAACLEGHFDCAKVLIDSNADLNLLSKTHETAIMITASSGQSVCLNALLETRKIDLNAKDSQGLTATMLACVENRVECLRLLVEFNADINICDDKFSSTALMMSSVSGHADCVELLLRHRAYVDHYDANCRTALIMTTHGNFISCVEIFLSYGANPNTVETQYGFSALSLAERMELRDMCDLLKQRSIEIRSRSFSTLSTGTVADFDTGLQLELKLSDLHSTAMDAAPCFHQIELELDVNNHNREINDAGKII